MIQPIVCKFGGTSVADAERVRQVEAIVRADPRRRYVVVSAPGKRHRGDQKITDLLFLCHRLVASGLACTEPYQVIADRFRQLAADLGVPGAADTALQELWDGLQAGHGEDWAASRGEHLSAKVIAQAFGATYVETADHLGIDRRGLPTPETYPRLGQVLAGKGLYVIPGYYGCGPDGEVKVFSRGGSDISGAVVARAVDASVYENWTDVSGFMMADPRIVPAARSMREVTYAELRELSYMGASVLHEEAVFPVKEAGIPIHIRNTARPDDHGTLIVESREGAVVPVVGIAGKPTFSVIYIYKHLMNRELGFGRKVLDILQSHGISYEHTPTGIDSMSVVVADSEIEGKQEAVQADILSMLHADECQITSGMALLSVVGVGMDHHVGIAARCFTALAEAGVNVRMISQGVGELSIIIGVAREDFESSVAALYHAFVAG